MAYNDDDDIFDDEEEEVEGPDPEDLQRLINERTAQERAESGANEAAANNLRGKVSNGIKNVKNNLSKAFKESLAKVIKTIGQLIVKALSTPYGWIALGIIILIIIAVIVVLELTSSGSISVNNDYMDDTYKNKEDISPEEKEAYDLWEEAKSLLLVKITDIDSMYDKYIEYIGKNKDDSLDDMKSDFGSDEYKKEDGVLPTQKRELYKHILMTEKYNFNTIKWKKYSAKGNGASRTLSEDEKVKYKNDESNGLKYPTYGDKELSYFVSLVNPYLQSHFIPLSMYSLSVNQNKNGDGKNAAFAYAIIKEAASDITMNIYQLDEYSEVWEHEEFEIENGNIMSGYKCQFSGTKGVEKEVEASCDNYTNVGQQNACKAGAIPKPKVKTTVSEPVYEAVYQGETREKFSTVSSNTAEILANSYTDSTYQYKPYMVKSFDVMLEFSYDFVPYNTANSPDSTSQISIPLEDEEKKEGTSYSVEGRCNANNQDEYFTVKTGTYQLRKNRQLIQVTKTWKDKLNSTGMTHRQYDISDVEEYLFGKGSTSKTDGDIIIHTGESSKELVIKDVEDLKKAFEAYEGSDELVKNAEAFIEMQNKYKVNALFAAAVSIGETSAGRFGHAVDGHNNWFNIKGDGEGGWKQYDSAKDSIMDFGNLIANRDENDGHDYFNDNRKSIKQIAKVYCPNTPDDPNAEENWINDNLLPSLTSMYSAVKVDIKKYMVSTNIETNTDSDSNFTKKAKKYYEDLVKDFESGSCSAGINRIDMINAKSDIYSDYVKKAEDRNISVRKNALYLSYNLLRKNLKTLEDEDKILPYIYGQTLCLNENYNFDGLINKACNSYSGSGEYLLPVPSNSKVAYLQGYTAAYGHTHEGVDIWPGEGSNGTDIAATRDGVVYLAEDGGYASGNLVSAGTGNGYGNHIIIQHDNGYYTLYGHLLSGTFKVKTGDTVKAGQIIATMGSSGNSSGTHLHYNISKTPYVFNGEPSDPLLFYNVEPVSSSYPAYDQLDKSTVSEPNVYKISEVATDTSGSSSLDGFLFIGDSRTHGVESELKGLGKDISVKGVDSSTQSEWLSVVKNGSGTVQGTSVSLPSNDKVKGVSVALGVNAITDTSNMEKLLDALLERYKGKKIYVNSVFPVATTYSYASASDLNKNIKKFNKKIKEKCSSEKNLVYIDVTDGLTDSDGYLKSGFADAAGLHLSSSEAKKKLANNIKAGITGKGGSSGASTVDLSFLGIGSDLGGSYPSAADKWLSSCKKWGEAYGLDPYLILSLIIDESGGDLMTGKNSYPAAGIMQIENVNWGKSLKLPFINGKSGADYGVSDTVTIEESKLRNDGDYCIMIGAAYLKNTIKSMDYNILVAIQGYNYGSWGIEDCITNFYLKTASAGEFQGKSFRDYIKTGDVSWLTSNCRQQYTSTRGAGTANYVNRVMSFYNPVDGMPYVINDDGEKISLDGSINAACGNSGDSSETSTSEGPEGSNVGEGKWKQDVETDNKSKKISTYTNAKGQKYYLYNQSSYGSSAWTNSGCGQTSSAIIISGLMGKNVDPAQMFQPYLTQPGDIVSFLNTHGVEVIKQKGNFGGKNLAASKEDVKYMQQQLSKGNPIIIGINGGTWINAGGYNYHWMTILGIKEDGSIFVGDPGGSYRDGWVKWSDFGGKYTAEIGVYLVCRKK